MKIFGGILILLASVTYSYFYEAKYKENIRQLKSIKSFLEYIYVQIEYFSSPLTEIFQTYKTKDDYIDELIKTKRCNIAHKELEESINNCLLSLGSSFKKEQLSIISYTNAQIEKKITEITQAYPQKMKINRSMSLFVGACIIILLV